MTIRERIHPDFKKKLVIIRNDINDKHGIKLTFVTITKIVADKFNVEEADIFGEPNKTKNPRKPKKQIGEIKSGFTQIFRR